MGENRNMCPAVAVLMSTYNGEKYIKEQLDSIFNQKEVQVTLYVRDDGSTDNTLDIIKAYHNDIILLPFDENKGPGLSFMTLLYHVMGLPTQYDYYAFADQDDIWMDEKLIKAIQQIKNEGECVLYSSNQWLYENDTKTKLRYDFKPDLTLVGHISKNLLSGCTMVFDYAMAEKITSFTCPTRSLLNYRMHDAWVALIATLYGSFIYDENSYILYRIHSANTVGVKKDSVFKRLKLFLGWGKKTERYTNIRSLTAQLLLENENDYCAEDKNILESVAYYQRGLRNKIQLMRMKDIYAKSGESKFIFCVKVMLNIV